METEAGKCVAAGDKASLILLHGCCWEHGSSPLFLRKHTREGTQGLKAEGNEGSLRELLVLCRV